MPRAFPVVSGAYQATGLVLVLVSVPVAFDGGTSCGVLFSFLLSMFYFVLCMLRFLCYGTPLSSTARLLYSTQFVIIPSMLLLHLSRCSAPDLQYELLFRVSWPWRTCLAYATGPFAILEGFCALLAIQACGRSANSLARKSDVFLLAEVVAASVAISAGIYLLAQIYAVPGILSANIATLIGAALAVCIGLGSYGIWSRRGGVVESTLVFCYVVYQIYSSLTDFGPLTGWAPRGWARQALTDSPAIASYAEFMARAAALTPTGLKTMWQFLCAALQSVTPPVCVSLAVRLGAYFIAMRVVPYIRNGAREARELSRWVFLAYSFSPILIIMVYTHLLLQHSALPDTNQIWTNSRQAWQFWGWINIFTMLGLYAVELAISNTRPNDRVSDRVNDQALE